MAPKIVSIMMASVAADHLLLTDTAVKSEDRHLNLMDIIDPRTNDHSFSRQYLKDKINMDTYHHPQKNLCKDYDPKEQGQFFEFGNQDWDTIIKECIDLNKTALTKLYYLSRNANTPVPDVKLWYRKTDNPFSSARYCEDLTYIVNQKLNGNLQDRDAEECDYLGENWTYVTLNLEAINRRNPVNWHCDRQQQRAFTSYEGKTCSQYQLNSSEMCAGGLPTFDPLHRARLGKKNGNGQSIVNTCCACSERRSIYLNKERKLIENYATMSEVICGSPMKRGTGNARKTKWYWNGNGCSRFTYKGKGGNKNKFSSERKCKAHCGFLTR